MCEPLVTLPDMMTATRPVRPPLRPRISSRMSATRMEYVPNPPDQIPREWQLPEFVTSSLKRPLHQHATNLIALDIPRKSGILSDRELDITENYKVGALLDALATGKLSAVEVVTAYCKRANIAQELTQCLAETYYTTAIERAKVLDKIRADTGKPIGPLHGLPVSIKDMFNIDLRPPKKNAVLVDMLRQLGAVIFCKSIVPPNGTDDNFSHVVNPHNTVLSAGGSAGGEGALIALRGSPLGVGTDIGGSIRVPALCCGVYGFKPSAHRLPATGWAIPTLDGFGAIIPSAGPLSHSVEALEIFMKIIHDANPASLDTMALDIPWRTLDPLPADTRLKIGLLGEDPLYPLHPSMKRALADAARNLRAQGHNILHLPATTCHITDASEVFWEMFRLEPATIQARIQSNRDPLIAAASDGTMSPANAGSFEFVPQLSGMETSHKVSTLNIRRYIIEDSWRKLWYGNHLNVVIGPGAQGTAVKHGTFGWVAYTCFLNLLNYPSCVIPYGQASKELDPEPLILSDGQGGPSYIPEEVDGAPCHLQIFTTSLRDEECLRYAKFIDQCLKSDTATA